MTVLSDNSRESGEEWKARKRGGKLILYFSVPTSDRRQKALLCIGIRPELRLPNFIITNVPFIYFALFFSPTVFRYMQ